MNKTIVITGASSGIGKALADTFTVINTVIGISRTIPKDINYPYYACDLTNIEHIKRTSSEIISIYKTIDVLINCAGVGTGGAIEELSAEDLKWVFDVNVIGLVEITKALLPALKNNTKSKIINIGSVAGEITIPYQTSYSMAKASLQKFTEGLRMELKPFNVDVCTVLPGDTKTTFTGNRKTVIREHSPYYANVTKSIKKMEKDEQSGVSPFKVVKVVEKVMKKKRMPIKVAVGIDYKFFLLLKKILPARTVEFIILKMYG